MGFGVVLELAGLVEGPTLTETSVDVDADVDGLQDQLDADVNPHSIGRVGTVIHDRVRLVRPVLGARVGRIRAVLATSSDAQGDELDDDDKAPSRYAELSQVLHDMVQTTG